MDAVPARKPLRLAGYDYSKEGCYFITICTRNRRNVLGTVVGGDAHIAPQIYLTKYGDVVEKYIKNINKVYDYARVDKYVIMPNHIHLIIALTYGAMWASPPTKTEIPKILRSLKTLVTKETGIALFQKSYHDHILRDERDYLARWQYIDNNPAKWAEDEYYYGK